MQKMGVKFDEKFCNHTVDGNQKSGHHNLEL